MTLSLILACIWAVAANFAAAVPSNDNHWRRAYVLMAVGLPLLVWVFWQNGLWVGLIVLAAGLSVLRWPVIALAKWLRTRFGSRRNT